VPPLVSVAITTWNSASTLARCLESVFAHDYPDLDIVVVDNASVDGTRAILERFADRCTVVLNDANTGFAAAQNQAIARSRGSWVLSLNPDVLLGGGFIRRLVSAGESDTHAGAVCGKLLRWQPGAEAERTRVLDSTGIVFFRNLRHLDRGAEEIDSGQYDAPEFVFGATGAAALYRRTMIEDISVFGEFFDEDFFAYREDADLAWRAQLFGWRCMYVPDAVAWHVRRVTPERRSELPTAINWHSVKNRFLMRAKNLSRREYLHVMVPTTARDMMIAAYALLRDQRMISALMQPLRLRNKLREKRAWIQGHRRVGGSEILRWFR
jgi:GT2 family glycosyltransferase